MEFMWGVITGGTSSFVLFLFWGRRLYRRNLQLRSLEIEASFIETRRQTIESERDTVARRSDYVVGESDLLGTLPGVMTKDHLGDSSRFSAKPVDLQPDWFTLEDVTGSDGPDT
jgi:hypothetical protein